MAGLDPIESSAEMPLDEEDDDVDGISMIYVASDELKGEFSRFNEGSNNGILEELADLLKCNYEKEYLENRTVGHLLNQLSEKEGINLHGIKSV